MCFKGRYGKKVYVTSSEVKENWVKVDLDEAARLLRTIYFFEHSKHVLKVAMVHEPDTGIFFIFLKGHCREKKQ
jgi:hypothetical protein